MILPIRTDSPLHGSPWMNWALILVNCLVFVVELYAPRLAAGYELKTYDPRVIHFFTYAFLHVGWAHLIGNMLFLYIFGNNVNDKMGNFGYLGFYLAGGVAAGIGYVVTGSAYSSVIGASGAVAAVTGAYLVLFPRSSITVIYFFYLIGSLEIPSLWFIVFFFAKDLFFSFAGSSGVAHTAHVGGTLFGFTVCMILLAVHLLPRDQFDVLALLGRWNRRRQYRGMVNSGFDPFGYRGGQVEKKQPTYDPRTEQAYALRGQISDALTHHRVEPAARLYLQLRALDPQQVLARQAQLDVANQLAGMRLYAESAEAYELFLKHYANYEQVQQVQLMLGLIYARYLHQPGPARDLLGKALPRLREERERQLAEAELRHLGTAAPPPLP